MITSPSGLGFGRATIASAGPNAVVGTALVLRCSEHRRHLLRLVPVGKGRGRAEVEAGRRVGSAPDFPVAVGALFLALASRTTSSSSIASVPGSPARSGNEDLSPNFKTTTDLRPSLVASTGIGRGAPAAHDTTPTKENR